MFVGQVVYIVERKHSRAVAGNIRPMSDNSQENVLFAPNDHRVSRIIVPVSDCPQGVSVSVSASLSKSSLSLFLFGIIYFSLRFSGVYFCCLRNKTRN